MLRTAVLTALLLPLSANAIEVTGMKDFPDLHGRYAPAGDCSREPLIVVDPQGISITVSGKTERYAKVEYAASYGGNFYQGIVQWFFPYGAPGNWPVIMAFNADETRDKLTISANDEGWKGGPPLKPRNKALVDASPYRKCR
ncbi:hypothetical protein CSC70_08920 [Pseudoxanthomonas kalamensis DSM 18571]|nr:hypothetical protein CSC70_08920 [Pseudoxanthomonas kalamensis DSM 18571]